MIIDSLRQYLLDQTAIYNLVDDRILIQPAPADLNDPFISILINSNSPLQSNDGYSNLDQVQIDFNAHAERLVDASRVNDALFDAIVGMGQQQVYDIEVVGVIVLERGRNVYNFDERLHTVILGTDFWIRRD